MSLQLPYGETFFLCQVNHFDTDNDDTYIDKRSHAPLGLSYHPAAAGPAGVVLLRPTSNTEAMAECVELDLTRRITAWREGKGWSTVRRLT